VRKGERAGGLGGVQGEQSHYRSQRTSISLVDRKVALPTILLDPANILTTRDVLTRPLAPADSLAYG